MFFPTSQSWCGNLNLLYSVLIFPTLPIGNYTDSSTETTSLLWLSFLLHGSEKNNAWVPESILPLTHYVALDKLILNSGFIYSFCKIRKKDSFKEGKHMSHIPLFPSSKPRQTSVIDHDTFFQCWAWIQSLPPSHLGVPGSYHQWDEAVSRVEIQFLS